MANKGHRFWFSLFPVSVDRRTIICIHFRSNGEVRARVPYCCHTVRGRVNSLGNGLELSPVPGKSFRYVGFHGIIRMQQNNEEVRDYTPIVINKAYVYIIRCCLVLGR